MQIYWTSSWLLLQKRSIPPAPGLALLSRLLSLFDETLVRCWPRPGPPLAAIAANQVPVRYVRFWMRLVGRRHGGECVSSRPMWRADLLEGFVGRFESSRLISMCHSGRKCATQHLLMKHILSESSALGPFTDATWDGKMSARVIYRHFFHQILFWREYCCQWFQYWLVNI